MSLRMAASGAMRALRHRSAGRKLMLSAMNRQTQCPVTPCRPVRAHAPRTARRPRHSPSVASRCPADVDQRRLAAARRAGNGDRDSPDSIRKADAVHIVLRAVAKAGRALSIAGAPDAAPFSDESSDASANVMANVSATTHPPAWRFAHRCRPAVRLVPQHLHAHQLVQQRRHAPVEQGWVCKR